MAKDRHFTCLENMYLAAPINAFYQPTIEIAEALATIDVEISEKFYHAMDAVHGSVYFKMLDDAAFFAASSLEKKFFVFTNSFTTYLTRPVSSGAMRAVGRVVHRTRTQFICESVVHDDRGQEAGRGSGIFARGKWPLKKAAGYHT
jgi:uncharacterized protein (TIGR00369 family)